MVSSLETSLSKKLHISQTDDNLNRLVSIILERLFHLQMKNILKLCNSLSVSMLEKLVSTKNMFETSKDEFPHKCINPVTVYFAEITSLFSWGNLNNKSASRALAKQKLKLSLRDTIRQIVFFTNYKAKKYLTAKRLMRT